MKIYKLSQTNNADIKIHVNTLRYVVDRMLQITHQRGDLAALFVEGGATALTDLYLWEPEKIDRTKKTWELY